MKAFNLDDRVMKKKDGSITMVTRGLTMKTAVADTTLRRTSASRKAKSKSPKQCVITPSNREQVQPAYQTAPGIPVVKKTDLLSLCKDNLIPKPYHQFFQNLKTFTNVVEEDALDTSEEDSN